MNLAGSEHQRCGYCREGYLEIERRSILKRIQINGECKEAATDADRGRYQKETDGS